MYLLIALRCKENFSSYQLHYRLGPLQDEIAARRSWEFYVGWLQSDHQSEPRPDNTRPTPQWSLRESTVHLGRQRDQKIVHNLQVRVQKEYLFKDGY